MAMRLFNLDAAVLDEAFEQLNTLLKHLVPGVISGNRSAPKARCACLSALASLPLGRGPGHYRSP